MFINSFACFMIVGTQFSIWECSFGYGGPFLKDRTLNTGYKSGDWVLNFECSTGYSGPFPVWLILYSICFFVDRIALVVANILSFQGYDGLFPFISRGSLRDLVT